MNSMMLYQNIKFNNMTKEVKQPFNKN